MGLDREGFDSLQPLLNQGLGCGPASLRLISRFFPATGQKY